MKNNLADTYSLDWMKRVARRETAAGQVMANTLWNLYRPVTVLDVGCGPCIQANALAALGCQVTAVDGASHAADFAEAGVVFLLADLTHPLELGRLFDLVLCLEVAEHLPESSGDGLCATLAHHCAGTLVFTAAPPGQDGHDHINLKPHAYWVDRLVQQGFVYQPQQTSHLQALWKGGAVPAYYAANLMVFSGCRD